jgi:hypothetical protein
LSSEPTGHSDDIIRLCHARLDLVIEEGHLIIGHVPYVDSQREVRYGTLVSTLEVAPTGETVRPTDHKVWFAGETPCDRAGNTLPFLCESRTFEIIPHLSVHYCFSLKPDEQQYRDYFHKMTYYIAILNAEALAIDPNATAKTNEVVGSAKDDSPFVYEDTASSRAGIRTITAKLRLAKVAVVGLGGTGSYILDLIAKCPIGEIHLYDEDIFEQHNAFRAPGAASVAQLEAKPSKVNYFAELYSNMHRKVIPHPYAMEESRVDELRSMDFVFISLGDGLVRRVLVDHLERFNIDFIDVGLSVSEVGGALTGMVRVTTSVRDHRQEAHDLMTFSDGEAEELYSRNIQLADLNCLNAALAVGRFKRWCGFFIDHEGEIESLYMTVGNGIANRVPGA